MTISKKKAYLVLVTLICLSCFLYQLVWLISGTTNGTVLQFGHGVGRGYKKIEYVSAEYTVRTKTYVDQYLKSDVPDTASTISIRYLLFAPSISRLNTTVGNWGLTLVVFVILFSCTTIVFIKNDIIPNNSFFTLKSQYPFIRLDKPTEPSKT
jgi:hypothetical protein